MDTPEIFPSGFASKSLIENFAMRKISEIRAEERKYKIMLNLMSGLEEGGLYTVTVGMDNTSKILVRVKGFGSEGVFCEIIASEYKGGDRIGFKLHPTDDTNCDWLSYERLTYAKISSIPHDDLPVLISWHYLSPAYKRLIDSA